MGYMFMCSFMTELNLLKLLISNFSVNVDMLKKLSISIFKLTKPHLQVKSQHYIVKLVAKSK